MYFNSLYFIVFFFLVFVLYYLLPHRARWLFLLVAGYFYYASFEFFFPLVLFCVTLLQFLSARLISSTDDKAVRKIYLWVNIIVTLAILVVLKYAFYIIPPVTDIGGALELFNRTGAQTAAGPARYVMPVGISFYTLQALSYILDVYYKKIKPVENFGRLALLFAYFPKLILGPIERAGNFMPRLEARVTWDSDKINKGLGLMLWGFFKKLAVADRLGEIINPVYANPSHYNTALLWIAFILFPLQLYADFSGYIDIARGCSRMLGIEISINFNLPFLARSITDFWTRWNMTVSQWFRDYVFYPLYLKIKRLPYLRIEKPVPVHNFSFVCSLTVMFILLGGWHNISLTFVAAALCQVIFIVVETFFPLLPVKSGLNGAWSIVLMRLVRTYFLFCVTALFFRSITLSAAFAHIKNMLVANAHGLTLADYGKEFPLPFLTFFAFTIINLVVMLVTEVIMADYKTSRYVTENFVLRVAVYIVIFMLILYTGILYKSVGFQYVQF